MAADQAIPQVDIDYPTNFSVGPKGDTSAQSPPTTGRESNSPVSGPPSAGGVRHGHLWRSPTGLGLHAPPGTLVRDETGAACCHFCGRWFRALGSHVRVHGYSASQYRETLGLSKTRALAAPSVSARISRRQLAAYRSTPEMRAHFAIGHELARNGTLAAYSIAAGSQRRSETDGLMRTALAKGRLTTSARRSKAREAQLSVVGATTLTEYLQIAYARGASLDQLAKETRLGRKQLRDAMNQADITVRPIGRNTADGKRSRARRANEAAAEKVGTDDLVAWLTTQRAQGRTLGQLATAVGHSAPWVRWRLESGR
jgi:predicted transcriptional regulator